MTCVQHLLSWMTLNEPLADSLIGHMVEMSMWREGCSNVSVAGLTALTELFYRQVALPQAHIIARGLKEIITTPKLKKSNEM